MLKTALVVKLEAKSGKEEEVAKFLAGALPLAEGEDFTPVWFALRQGKSTFYIVDAFASDADRTRHLDGEIASALMAKKDELLAEPPSIQPVEVMASKVEA